MDGKIIISYFDGSNNIFADCNKKFSRMFKMVKKLGDKSDREKRKAKNNLLVSPLLASNSDIFT